MKDIDKVIEEAKAELLPFASWEKLPRESGAAYAAFCAYRDYGPERNIRKAVHPLRFRPSILERADYENAAHEKDASESVTMRAGWADRDGGTSVAPRERDDRMGND